MSTVILSLVSSMRNQPLHKFIFYTLEDAIWNKINQMYYTSFKLGIGEKVGNADSVLSSGSYGSMYDCNIQQLCSREYDKERLHSSLQFFFKK